MTKFVRVASVGFVLAMLGPVWGEADNGEGREVCAGETGSSALDDQEGFQADDDQEETNIARTQRGSSLLARSTLMTRVEATSEETTLEDQEESQSEDEEDQETTDELEEEKVGEEDPGEVRNVPDLESAENELLQESIMQEQAAQEEFLREFDAIIDSSLGSNGAAVVMRFDKNEEPCPSNAFLHDTFVHADMLTGTFVCKPCHAACTSGCTGAEAADCLAAQADSSLAGVSATVSARTKSRSAFADSFASHLRTLNEDGLSSMEGYTAGLDMSELPGNVTQCIADGSCSVTEVNVSETSSVNTSTATFEVVYATAMKGNLTDPVTLKTGAQRALNTGLQAAGFIPGLTTEAPLWDEADNVSNATEDGPPNTPPGADSGLTQGSLIEQQEQRHCESMMEAKLARLNQSLQALSYSQETKFKGISKDWVNLEAKKRAKDYAKQNIKDWINAQEGDCLNALDELIGASQRLYACFQENFHNVKYAFCEPPKRHAWLLSKMQSMLSNANVLKTVSSPLRSLPYVNAVAKKTYKLGLSIDSLLVAKVRTLESMKKKPHGTRVQEQPDCCSPFPKEGCSASPGAAYKCASCSGGGMCTVDRGCHTLEKFEAKVDEWKSKYYDPILVKVAEATQHVQAANNAASQMANTGSYLAKCQGSNFDKCSEVKKLTDKIVAAMGGNFVEKHCPIKMPSIPFPKIDPIKPVISFLAKISDAFAKVLAELRKRRCISVPRVKVWMERKCRRICTPCCSYRGRRRWTGSVRCNSCCWRACIRVPRTKVWMHRYCFSGMQILQGIAGFIQTLLGPVMKVLERVINFIMKPIKALLDKILGLLKINLDFKFPSLPSFDFSLPTLPAVDCNRLKSFAGR
jgi:hypothetical protein